MQVDGLIDAFAPANVIQHLCAQIARTPARVQSVLEDSHGVWPVRDLVHRKLHAAQNSGQEIVEVMRHTSREQPHAFEPCAFLGAFHDRNPLFFRLPAKRFVAGCGSTTGKWGRRGVSVHNILLGLRAGLDHLS
jgi:hypothetical protein